MWCVDALDALDALGVAAPEDVDVGVGVWQGSGVVNSAPAALGKWGVSGVDLEEGASAAAVASLPRLKFNLRMVLPAK